MYQSVMSMCDFFFSLVLGDSTCILWDVETKNPKVIFDSHAGDVMSVSLGDKGSVFVSGSCDSTAKVFEPRVPRCVATFAGHESDVNSVQMYPDSTAFCTGSDDSSCRFFDMRFAVVFVVSDLDARNVLVSFGLLLKSSKHVFF